TVRSFGEPSTTTFGWAALAGYPTYLNVRVTTWTVEVQPQLKSRPRYVVASVLWRQVTPRSGVCGRSGRSRRTVAAPDPALIANTTACPTPLPRSAPAGRGTPRRGCDRRS